MSEQLQNELNQAKASIAQLGARLAANEQFTNGLLKDLLETKTNLNLYMQAHKEVSDALAEGKKASEQVVNELTAKNEALSKELEGLRNPVCLNGESSNEEAA